MKKSILKVFLGFVVLFFLMFFFRLGFGYYSYPSGSTGPVFGEGTINLSQRVSNNFASSNYKYKKMGGASPEIVSVDQKYEKTANINCKSVDFDKDEKQLRKTIEEKNTIIQFQQKSGNKGSRLLTLQIGVPPNIFDEFIEIVKANHKITGFNVTKKDKTNEYRELASKIKTLQATRASLVELKSKGGKIDEFISLENRILNIDESLQDLGVKMGSFDSENEFCTVNISMREGQVNTISLIQRIKVALEWTIEYYAILIFIICMMLLSALFLVTIIDKLKILARFQKEDHLE